MGASSAAALDDWRAWGGADGATANRSKASESDPTPEGLASSITLNPIGPSGVQRRLFWRRFSLVAPFTRGERRRGGGRQVESRSPGGQSRSRECRPTRACNSSL